MRHTGPWVIAVAQSVELSHLSRLLWRFCNYRWWRQRV